MQALIDNPWQGNVRELNHVVERSVLLAQDTHVRLADLALRSSATGADATRRDEPRRSRSVPDQESARAL